MKQVILRLDDGARLLIPAAEARCGDLRWGNVAEPFSPAFWKAQAFLWGESPPCHRLGRGPIEEAVACVLCTHGVRSEVGLAAFRRLRDDGLIRSPAPAEGDLAQALMQPVMVGGRLIRYRFPNVKARVVHELLGLDEELFSRSTSHELRERLVEVRGIGMKVGSWIARNICASDDLAVLDIHVLRAGVLTGFFDEIPALTHAGYRRLEAAYIGFCRTIDVHPARLDSIIWSTMRAGPSLVASRLDRRTHCVRRRQLGWRSGVLAERSGRNAVLAA